MKKTVVTKIKANLRFQTITKDINQHCFQGFWLAYTTVIKTNTKNQLINDF